MKYSILFLFFLPMLSCSDEPTKDSPEKTHRINNTLIILPNEFNQVMEEKVIEGMPPTKSEITLTPSETNAYFLKEKENGELITMVQLATRGRRVEIIGENYHEYMNEIEKINRDLSAEGMNLEIIEKDAKSKTDPKYFKVKSLVSSPAKDTSMMIQYLITNNIRTVSVIIWNTNHNDTDLEEYVKKMLLF